VGNTLVFAGPIAFVVAYIPWLDLLSVWLVLLTYGIGRGGKQACFSLVVFA
jgi:hypothetical protein